MYKFDTASAHTGRQAYTHTHARRTRTLNNVHKIKLKILNFSCSASTWITDVMLFLSCVPALLIFIWFSRVALILLYLFFSSFFVSTLLTTKRSSTAKAQFQLSRRQRRNCYRRRNDPNQHTSVATRVNDRHSGSKAERPFILRSIT